MQNQTERRRAVLDYISCRVYQLSLSKPCTALFPNPHSAFFFFIRMNVQSFGTEDPFASEEDPLQESSDVDLIHIRIQQRNGRKTLTTLQGLPKSIDSKKLLRAFKKEFACNGTLIVDDKMGEVIQLQGDQRAKINAFLIENGMDKAIIKVHGF